jgi:hypothetical protein
MFEQYEQNGSSPGLGVDPQGLESQVSLSFALLRPNFSQSLQTPAPLSSPLSTSLSNNWTKRDYFLLEPNNWLERYLAESNSSVR